MARLDKCVYVYVELFACTLHAPKVTNVINHGSSKMPEANYNNNTRRRRRLGGATPTYCVQRVQFVSYLTPYTNDILQFPVFPGRILFNHVHIKCLPHARRADVLIRKTRANSKTFNHGRLTYSSD